MSSAAIADGSSVSSCHRSTCRHVPHSRPRGHVGGFQDNAAPPVELTNKLGIRKPSQGLAYRGDAGVDGGDLALNISEESGAQCVVGGHCRGQRCDVGRQVRHRIQAGLDAGQ